MNQGGPFLVSGVKRVRWTHETLLFKTAFLLTLACKKEEVRFMLGYTLPLAIK